MNKKTHPKRICQQLIGIALAGTMALQFAQAGSVAIINGSTLTSETGTTTDITNHLKTLEVAAGNSVTIFDTPPADLSAFAQIWDIRFSNSSPLTSDVMTQYLNFLQGGKSMFLMGENGGFMTRNNAIFSFVNQAGGGSLTFANVSNTQQVSAAFGGGNMVYSAAGGVTNPGTGTFITTSGTTAGTAVAWSRGTLTNARQGTLSMVLDVNFMQASANAESMSFLQSLVSYLADASTPAVLPDPVLYTENTGAILSANTTGLWVPVAHRQVIFNAVQTATQDINERLFRLRARTMQDEIPATVAQRGGKQIVDGKGNYKQTEELAPLDRRWDFFVAGNYGYGDVEARATTAGFGSDIYAGTAGAEFAATPNLTLGVAVTSLESNQRIGNNSGSLDIGGMGFSGYLSWFWKNLYADALYNFGTFSSDIRRDTLLGSTATARPDTQSQTIQLNTGYNLKVCGFTTGPIAALDYINGSTDSYNEARGGSANLAVNGQNFDSLISRIGWQASYPVQTCIGKVTPQVRASWAHEYLNGDELVDVSLINTPYAVVNQGLVTPTGRYRTSASTTAPGQDYLVAGAGVMVALGERASVTVDYNTRFFQADSVTHCVSLTGSLKF